MSFLIGVSRKYTILAGSTLGLAWLWFALDRPQVIPTQVIWNGHSDGLQTDIHSPTLDQHDIFDFPPVNSNVMKAVCERQTWNSSIIFTCDSNRGGVGHVRNSILNCVRYAIGAGGSLVMPNIKLREDIEGLNMMPVEGEEESHLEKRHGLGWKGMDYMFDADHFKTSLKMSCPELKVIDHMEQTVNGRRRGLVPESLFMNRPTSGLEHPDEWQEKLQNWVEKWMSPTPQTIPIVVDLEQSNLQYPTHADGHIFAHEFGQIMKFRPDVRRLATSTLRQISSWYDVTLNVSSTIVTPSFLGIHLKTEPEDTAEEILKRHVTPAPFMHYDGQAKAYIALAKSMKTPIIYAASGDIESTNRLAIEAKAHGIDVAHKEHLLKDHEREELSHLRWDQRALVDYLVLLRGEHFAGVGHSFFSWNVMLKRHESALLKQKLKDEVYADDLSSLYGVRASYLDSAKCMWA
ncbi:hypothetical protein DSL72_008817 [Monilinia vaccinii-corymbosi]|uniref:Alternative oxidase n=1 Tax=Monilinia vaccinii-corymbosi TaxID=61207 RepID=A0A8A3PQG4_9HELO|nr:hypothetical protein DSL72_008817 [Monilinia vaccinii-corymbosi]